MILDFSQNNMKIVFEVTEAQRVVLKDFSVRSYQGEPKEKLQWCAITDVHLAGENPNDHHGAKHTGTSGSFSLKYKTHRYYENEYGNKLEFDTYDDKIAVTQHYQFYRDLSVVRAWTTVTNIGTDVVGLEYVSSFAYTGLENHSPFVYIPHNTWCREMNWKKYTLSELGLDRTTAFSMKRIMASNVGTWSSKEYLPMGAMSDTYNTLMWQIESNGSWQWEISDIADMLYVKLSGPTEQEGMWYKELEQNETFESVKVCVVLSDNFDNALGQLTKYRRVIFQNNKPNSKLPVIFNDYMNCLKADPTTEKVLPMVDRAAEAGAEYYCMDAGWYADGNWWDTVGEWQPCSWRFPNGIKEVFDYIRDKGMVPGIWLEIESMGVNCPILDQFDDECFFMRHGKKVIDHGRYQLDFRHEKVRQFATSVVDRVVNEYGVGYIKMDYNIEAGVGTEVDADSFGDGLLQWNRAYLSWIEEITNKYPDLIWENCASGGMRMDYAMLQKTHIQSSSDQTDYKHNAVIAANAATAVLPEQCAVWSYPLADEDENSTTFNMVNSLLLRIHLSGEILNLSDDKFGQVKEGVECYKKIRSDIPKFIPFYPLGLNAYYSGWACVGYKAEEKRYLAVWRFDSKETELTIPINDVKKVEVLYPSDSKCEIARNENCIRVCLPDTYSAVIIRV